MSSTSTSMAQDVVVIMIITPRVDTPDNGRQLGETSKPKKKCRPQCTSWPVLVFGILDSCGRQAKGAECVQVNKSSCLAVLTAVVDEQKGQKTYHKFKNKQIKKEPDTNWSLALNVGKYGCVCGGNHWSSHLVLALLTVVDEQKGQKTYQKLETANKKEISYNEPSTRAQCSTLLSPCAWYSWRRW